MQQALYNNSIHNSISGNGIRIQAATNTTTMTARRASLLRRIAHQWDMFGVLALMGSSAAYGVFALAHLGL